MQSIISKKTQNTFAQRLREIMEEQGIRQKDLCFMAGIGKSSMSQYLSGAFIPKEQKIRSIAKALDVSDDWLLGYDVPRSRHEIVTDDSVFEASITDDSMEKIHIPCRSLVTVHKCERDILKNGDIVCFSIGEEKHLVRHYHDNGRVIILTAVNPDYEPIIVEYNKVDSGEVVLHGIVEKISFDSKIL